MEENVKKDKIIFITISIIAIILIVFIIVMAVLKNIDSKNLPASEIYSYVTEDGTEINKSEQIKTIKKLESVSIQLNSLTEHKNYTKVLATVLNTTDKAIDETNVDIILLDNKGEEIIRLDGNIPSIEPGKMVELNSSIIGKYANAYDVKFVKK